MSTELTPAEIEAEKQFPNTTAHPVNTVDKLRFTYSEVLQLERKRFIQGANWQRERDAPILEALREIIERTEFAIIEDDGNSHESYQSKSRKDLIARCKAIIAAS